MRSITKKDFFNTLDDTLDSRRRRSQFASYLDENYNLNSQAYYRMLRNQRMEEWELKGLIACAEEFEAANRIAADTVQATEQTAANMVTVTVAQFKDIYQWFAQCDKMKFYDYMKTKGLCRDTIKKHMDDEDWTRLNLRGWQTAWNEFMGDQLAQ